MSYVEQVLQSGETVKHEGKISWALYIGGIVGLAIGAGLLLAAAVSWNEQVFFVGLALAATGAAGICQVWVSRRVTEIAITDRRIIYKTGLVRRSAIEMNLDKIESVDVQQSILGRLFDYGDVIVRGTGAGFEPMKGVDAPLVLRNSIHVPAVADHAPAMGKAA